MGLMELRRRVMLSMADGAKFIKGSFTVPDSGSTYQIDFGKEFTRYLFLIEADDDSKAIINDSEINASRSYAAIGMFPTLQINDTSSPHKAVFYRIHPISKAMTVDGIQQGNLSTTYISLPALALNGSGTNGLFKGLTYNYYVVEIK